MDELSEHKHGYYSKRQAEIGGELIWSRPDGSEVSVTEVTDGPESPELVHPDKVYVGPVVKFVRRISEGKFRPYRWGF